MHTLVDVVYLEVSLEFCAVMLHDTSKGSCGDQCEWDGVSRSSESSERSQVRYNGNVCGRVSAIGVVCISWRSVLEGLGREKDRERHGRVRQSVSGAAAAQLGSEVGGVGSAAASGCCVSGNSSASEAPLCVSGRVSSRAAPGPEVMPGSSVHTGQVDDGGFSGGVVIARRRQPQSWRQEGK